MALPHLMQCSERISTVIVHENVGVLYLPDYNLNFHRKDTVIVKWDSEGHYFGDGEIVHSITLRVRSSHFRT